MHYWPRQRRSGCAAPRACSARPTSAACPGSSWTVPRRSRTRRGRNHREWYPPRIDHTRGATPRQHDQPGPRRGGSSRNRDSHSKLSTSRSSRECRAVQRIEVPVREWVTGPLDHGTIASCVKASGGLRTEVILLRPLSFAPRAMGALVLGSVEFAVDSAVCLVVTGRRGWRGCGTGRRCRTSTARMCRWCGCGWSAIPARARRW